MENLESDAFVFFGATGDLASKQVFPALQAMIRHGHLDIPIIGVARSAENLDQLRAHARESLEKHGGVDARAFSTLSAKLQYVKGDYNSQETFGDLRKALGKASLSLSTMQQCLGPKACLPSPGEFLLNALDLNRQNSFSRENPATGKPRLEDVLNYAS